jgi:hypothetical protein
MMSLPFNTGRHALKLAQVRMQAIMEHAITDWFQLTLLLRLALAHWFSLAPMPLPNPI